MQFKKAIKKGFTLVELVVVIAVIAILAATSVGIYFGVTESAKKSNDQTVTNQMNKALMLDETLNGKPVTPSDALAVLETNGFDVTKMTPFQDGAYYLWDSTENKMILINKEGVVDFPADETVDGEKYEYFAFISSDEEIASKYAGYSYYLKSGYTGSTTFSTSVDAGDNYFETITYEGNSKVQASIIRTNGGKVEIDDAQDTINHYGQADEVYVKAVAPNTYNLYGHVAYLEVAAGQHVVLQQGSTVNAVFAANADDVDVNNGQSKNVHTGSEADKEAIKNGAMDFAGGTGTEASPYLISERKHFENIALRNDSYAYYKVKEGTSTIDLEGWGRMNINGSFDGNGVTFTNVDNVLFNRAGIYADSYNRAIVLENFNVDFVAGGGVVRNLATSDLTFKNVKVTGYILDDWNMGAFVRYGTRNSSPAGYDAELNFVNCSCSAEIYGYGTNNFSAILVGNPYPQDGSLVINLDEATNNDIEQTTLYYRGNTAQGYKYCCMATNTTVFVDGKSVDNRAMAKNLVKVDNTIAATKNDNNDYVVESKNSISKINVSLTFQYTAYTDATFTEKIEGTEGVGGVLGTVIELSVEANSIVKVFDAINDIELVHDENTFDYKVENGKLSIYMDTRSGFVDGSLTLSVEQYTSSRNIPLFSGTTVIATKTGASSFVIK